MQKIPCLKLKMCYVLDRVCVSGTNAKISFPDQLIETLSNPINAEYSSNRFIQVADRARVRFPVLHQQWQISISIR